MTQSLFDSLELDRADWQQPLPPQSWPAPAATEADGWDDRPRDFGPFRRPGAVRFAPSGRTVLETWGWAETPHREDGPAVIWRARGRIRQAWYRYGKPHTPTAHETEAWAKTEAAQGGAFRYPDRRAFQKAQAADPARDRPPTAEAFLRARGLPVPPIPYRPNGIKAAVARASARSTREEATR